MFNPFVYVIKKLAEIEKQSKAERELQEYYRIEHVDYYDPRKGR
tara:strand:+ start:738 stop:869 length:132 start_codon:yes stop_codon:yes gene_type:complete